MSAAAAIQSGYRALPSVDVRFFGGGGEGKRFLGDTRLSISKLDTFANITFVLLPPDVAAEGDEDFSNELPSSSASSASDRPLSHAAPRSEPHGNLRLEVAAPHYHEDQLQVKVYWKVSQHGELLNWTN